MLTSSQLSCALFDQPGDLPVPGLSNLIKVDSLEKIKVENGVRERALALAARLFKAAQLQHVPLPVLAAVAASPSSVTNAADGIDSSIIKQDRRLPVSSGLTTRSVMAPSAALSMISSPKATTAAGVAMMPKMSMVGRQPALDLIAATRAKSVTPKASLAASGLNSDSIKRLPEALKAITDTKQKTPGSPLASAVSRFSGSSNQPSSSQARTNTPLLNIIRSSSTDTASLPLPVITAMQSLDPKGSGTVEVNDAKRAIEIAVMPDQPAASSLTGSWSKVGEGRSSNPAMTSLHQMAVSSIPLPDGGSSYRQDLRLPKATSAGIGHVMRSSSGRMLDPTVNAAPAVSASSTTGGDHNLTSTTVPHSVNLTGAVNLDGRRLGRLTASFQARDASLPSRGPSRVNLRTVPVYSGMQIPS